MVRRAGSPNSQIKAARPVPRCPHQEDPIRTLLQPCHRLPKDIQLACVPPIAQDHDRGGRLRLRSSTRPRGLAIRRREMPTGTMPLDLEEAIRSPDSPVPDGPQPSEPRAARLVCQKKILFPLDFAECSNRDCRSQTRFSEPLQGLEPNQT